jgi:dihydrofolate synthase / folylpolyglutamate synthase
VRDFATSDDPSVQAQLDRLAALSLPQGRFGLDTIRELLARLGDPQKRMPPAFHVAGTNGKGSTCAYLRAMLEAEGLKVHAATKPHLVRYNERIRIAGELVSDKVLAELLQTVLDASEDLSPSFFEVTTAATFLAFATHPADACVIEVGLGGRFDATNVLERPAACGIASLGIDHEAFLLVPEEGVPTEPLARIAFEKASIARPGTPLVTQSYPQMAARAVSRTATMCGAELFMRGQAWRAEIGADGIAYQDAFGPLALPLPSLPGRHQADNAALAVAMLRHQDRVKVSPDAVAQGISDARWPARLQLLDAGPLTALVRGRKVWLDGGHNPDAGAAIARFFGTAERLHLIIGMIANKDPAAIVAPLAARLASISVVPAPGHDAHPPEAFAAQTTLPIRSFASVEDALRALPLDGDILIAGSLYLAGEVLRLNRQVPD